MRFVQPELGLWMAASVVAIAIARWRVRRRFVASTTVRWLSSPAYRASIVRRLTAAPDHPVSLYCPESEYLKGFQLTVV